MLTHAQFQSICKEANPPMQCLVPGREQKASSRDGKCSDHPNSLAAELLSDSEKLQCRA